MRAFTSWKILLVILPLTGLMINPPIRPEQGFCEPSLSSGHILGCNPLGQDIVMSLWSGLTETSILAAGGRAIGVGIAALLSLVAFFFSGWRQPVALLSDTLLPVPSLFVAMALSLVLPGAALVIAIAFSEWAPAQRWLLQRPYDLAAGDYVRASEAMGAGLMFRFRYHIARPFRTDTIFYFESQLAGAFLTVSALEFLGLGGGDGLGSQAARYKDYIFIHPALAIAPTLTLVVWIAALRRLFHRSITES